MRVFFDASVIIAAFLSPTGGSAKLFELRKHDILTGITTETVIDDLLEQSLKLRTTEGELREFIAKSELIVRESITFTEIEPFKESIDQKDAHLIAGAKLTKCSYLVTLDKKHLLREDIQQKFLPIRIVSPKKLLEELIK